MSKNNLGSIEKLSGRENYSTWKFQIKTYLIHENLWDCIVGFKADDSRSESEREELSEKALAKIFLSVKPKILKHIASAKRAQEAWSLLQKDFEDTGLTRRLSLLRKLFKLNLEQFPTMESYIEATLSITEQLEDIGAGLEDEFIGVLLLNGLPEEYNPLVMAIENSGAKITSDFIKTKLIQDGTKQVVNQEESATRLNQGPNQYLICGRNNHPTSNCRFREQNPNQTCDSSLIKFSSRHQTHSESEWWLDSGATWHVSGTREWLKDFTEESPIEVSIANNEKIQGEDFEYIPFKLKNNSIINRVSDVMYVPELATNLLSVGQLVKQGFTVVIDKYSCKIFEDKCEVQGKCSVKAPNVNGIFILNNSENKSKCYNLNTEIKNLWHRRLGHLNRVALLALNRKFNTISPQISKDPCEICRKGKQTRKPLKETNETRADNLLDLVHTDLYGPMPETSIGGASYMLLFIDDFSRKTFAYFLKSKSEVFENFLKFKALVEEETGKRIIALRTDNGEEYSNFEFEQYLKISGIEHQLAVPLGSEQEGVSERARRSIIEKARCMLEDAACSNKFWAEAANTAVYLSNRSPHKATYGKLPEEIWRGRKISISHLRIFGCKGFLCIPLEKRKKFFPISKCYIFVGYCENTGRYRLLDIKDPSILVLSRDVILIESEFPYKEKT